MKKLVFAVSALIIILFSSACEFEPKDQLCNPLPQFDIDLFVDNVRQELTDVAGYQLIVNQNGQLYHSEAEGFSIYAGDPGVAAPMTVDTRMNVASVSKFIGTIALMQVLEKHQISIEEPIHNYLPPRWKAASHGDHFDAGSPYLVRFRNLLRMETALAFPFGNSWSPGRMSSAQEMFTALTQPADPQRWGQYQNGNFTLIRVLIGQIEYGLDAAATNYDEVCADVYFNHIRQQIFDKLNLQPPMSVAAVNNYYAGHFTRAHQWPFNEAFQDGDGNVGWGATSNPVTNSGSGGLILSAFDLAKVMAYFRHDQNGTILSPNARDLILDHQLGLTESTDGEKGVYPSKGGTRGPQNGTSRALRSRIMFFPNGVEVVVLTNSNVTTLGTILRNSFDNAWMSKC
jgi:CubicO group peptidase (beta-lactamase class C family)